MGKHLNVLAADFVNFANASAVVARYDPPTWSDIAPFIDKLLEDDQLQAKAILKEGEQAFHVWVSTNWKRTIT